MNKRKDKLKKVIDFHKSTDEVLRAIDGHLCNMHNQPLIVNYLKNYHGFDKNLY
jgi:hypothetical protein